VIRALDLSLPAPELRRAAGLRGRWTDFMYVPGPGFTSPVESGLYTSSFVIVPVDGRPLRVSSFAVPAFGGELCRLRFEPLVSYRPDNLGSFFEPARRGIVYAMSADRRSGGKRPPDRSGWSYDGPSLARRLGDVTEVRVLRERVTGADGDRPFSWVADRGLTLTNSAGEQSLLLARPGESEQAALVSPPGLYRALLDPAAPAVPGATRGDLLGYGDWSGPLEIVIELKTLGPAA